MRLRQRARAAACAGGSVRGPLPRMRHLLESGDPRQPRAACERVPGSLPACGGGGARPRCGHGRVASRVCVIGAATRRNTPQQIATNRNKAQQAQQSATKRNMPQRRNKPQQTATSRNKPQQAATSRPLVAVGAATRGSRHVPLVRGARRIAAAGLYLHIFIFIGGRGKGGGGERGFTYFLFVCFSRGCHSAAGAGAGGCAGRQGARGPVEEGRRGVRGVRAWPCPGAARVRATED